MDDNVLHALPTFKPPTFHIPRLQWFIGLLLSVMMVAIAVPTLAASTPQQDMQRLDAHIEQAITSAEANQLSQSSTAFKRYKDEWFEVEDGVKATSRQAYKEIEQAMGEVKFAFSVNPPNVAQVVRSLKQLQSLDQKFIAGGFNRSSTTAQTAPADSNTASSKVTIARLIERLNRAEAAIGQTDLATATTEMKAFQSDWLEVEGIVAAKSKQAYTNVENNMAKATGFLTRNPVDIASATAAIAALKQDLQPYVGEGLRYTFLDSMLILLREGMEALLILVALLAFLNKSGNGDKSRWLWIGAGAGILASVATALVIQAVFSDLTAAGINRELMEGCTGLFAAAMLFYVSYWLHSKSSMGAWQGYIRGQVSSALAKNSLVSLALLAFLAVFREGGETVLFYIGIAPSIDQTALIGGLALASVLLVAIAFLMLRVGLQLPLKPFFLVTSLLIYYLGFKFVGAGIHALQVAGVLPTSPATFLPAWETVGVYPTWETTLPQLAILLVAVAIALRSRLQTTGTAS